MFQEYFGVCLNRRKIKGVILGCVAGGITLVASPSLAEEAVTHDEVVVTASRVPIETKKVGSSISVITSEQLEQRQTRLVSDILRDVPGLAVSTSGGVGASTQVRIRGAEANQTLVIIDGVEVNSPSFNSEFDFANLRAADIERIEILRGPQSALYGSDAIGGVVNIITKKGKSGFDASARAEAGSFGTREGGARLSGGMDGIFDAAIGVSGLTTNGISFADEDNGNSEDDGYDNLTINGNLRLYPRDGLTLGFNGRVVDSTTQADGFITQAVDNSDEFDRDQLYGRAFAQLDLFEESDWGGWDHTLGVAYAEDKFEASGSFPSNSDGFRTKFDYQTNLEVATPDFFDTTHGLTFLAEYEEEKAEIFNAFADVDREIETTSIAGEYRVGISDRLFVSNGVRHDFNDDLFSDETTFRSTAAYIFEETGTRFHGGYGEGVKNPTITELFGFSATFVGNPDLKPEQSKGWDIGVEQQLFQDRLTLDVTYFNNRIEDLIAGSGNTAINLPGTSKIQGVEVTAVAEIIEGLDIHGAYTWTDGESADGRELIRRPEHIASVVLNQRFRVFERDGNVNLAVRYNGEQQDDSFATFPAQRVTLDDYTLVNLAGSYELTEGLQLTGRIENLLDEDYQEVLSFGTPGISAFVGLKVSFGSILE